MALWSSKEHHVGEEGQAAEWMASVSVALWMRTQELTLTTAPEAMIRDCGLLSVTEASEGADDILGLSC